MPQPIRQAMSYSAIAQFASMGLQFGSSIVLTRQLGADQYGLYGIFFNWVATVSVLGDMGLSSAITKYTADSEADDDPAATYSVLSSALILHTVIIIALWLIFALAAPAASSIWFDNDGWLYLLFALAFPLQIWIADMTGALYGLRELKVVALRLVIQSGLFLVLIAVLVWGFGGGLHLAAGLYAGTLFVLFVWLLQYFIGLIRGGRLTVNHTLRLQQIIKFALPVAGIYPIQSLIRLTPVLLVKFLGEGQATVNQDVAFLSLALLLGSVVNGVVSALIKSGYGYLSRWVTQNAFQAFKKYMAIMQLLTLGAYGAAFLLSLIGLPIFINLVYGQDFLGANSYIVLTLVVTFTTTLAVLYNTALYALDSTVVSLRANIAEFILYASLVTLVYLTMTIADWGITLLMIAAVTGSIKAVILMLASLRMLHRHWSTLPPPMTVSHPTVGTSS